MPGLTTQYLRGLIPQAAKAAFVLVTAAASAAGI
jgi:hypothetical protein